MPRRFYVKSECVYWSFSKQGYCQFLTDGALENSPQLDASVYQARKIKKTPMSAQAIDVTDFETAHYREELEHFLKTDAQTGFSAADYVNIFFD